MNKITKRVATYMLAIAGLTFVFISCNEENEEVMNRKANYKSSISSGSNPYAFYEDNNFSDESILQMTAEFHRQLRDNTVSDMDIRHAVVLIETFWNYGFVAKQQFQNNLYIAEEVYQFTVNLTSSGDVYGSDLRTKYIQFLQNTINSVNGRNLNIGDFYVVAVTSNTVTFEVKTRPIVNTIDIVDEDLVVLPKFKIYNSNATSPYGNLVYTINPNTFSEYYLNNGETPVSLSDVLETNMMNYIRVQKTYLGIAINLKKLTDASSHKVAVPVLDSNNDTLKIEPSFYSSQYQKWQYASFTLSWLNDTYMPSVINAVNTINKPEGYDIIDFCDYGYKVPSYNPNSVSGEEIRFVIGNITIGHLVFHLDISDWFNNVTYTDLEIDNTVQS